MRLTGNCKPALLERETPFFAGTPAALPVFDFPLAFPPAMTFFNVGGKKEASRRVPSALLD